ncbi:arsenate reductase family protein [Yoonia sediminilitoris]|uniref:Arsenate reductase-like glutaredoxin family protein n=1 Tax=Yoonia sediminilitoris TaxID=1286148 RepID=A0A2T6KJT8_9RHOB|nr:ArsC/Spx/MgsR family protein [Yoonia sediminilitoris]PUB16234.1 arsenate reductase-like glutaredoxin family protein [Yoonia sediminilitoris]RCW96583.1 arsenate reductase-like glutaredoxin family protein [Yoonia sediminilitoris]
MKFFGLKTCDTCRKARKSLAEAGYDPTIIDVRADGVAPEDLAQIIATFGAAVINKSSTTWRGLTDEEKAGDPMALLAAHPTLMKRPAIEADGNWTIGWKPDVQSVYLKA